MKHQNGLKTDKVVSFVTAITNYGKILVVLLQLLQTTVKKVVKQFLFIFRYENIFWILKANLKHERQYHNA